MTDYQAVFRRVERKYLLTTEQYRGLRERIECRFLPDRYFKSTIRNIYFDTSDYYLIRESLEKPRYKEKLRLRSYDDVSDDSRVFIEIKKKYDGVVYKRRIGMRYSYAMEYLYRDMPPHKEEQITHEIDFMRNRYHAPLRPAMYLAYDREAYYCEKDKNLRITFDEKIRWRTDRLELSESTDGNAVLPPDLILMEIKIPGALPTWLASDLTELSIFPTSFSKYGRAFEQLVRENNGKSADKASGALFV